MKEGKDIVDFDFKKRYLFDYTQEAIRQGGEDSLDFFFTHQDKWFELLGINKSEDGGIILASFLTQAIKYQQKKIMSELLVQDFDVNVVDVDGELPLILAIKRDDYATVKMLLEYGADVNATNYNDEDAFAHIKNASKKIQNILLKR